MMHNLKSMNAVSFGRIDFRFNIYFDSSSQETLGLPFNGRGLTPANKCPPQPFSREHTVFFVAAESQETNTLPHHTPFFYIP